MIHRMLKKAIQRNKKYIRVLRIEEYYRTVHSLVQPRLRPINPSSTTSKRIQVILTCYEPLERFIDIMERRQSNGGQQRHYPFRHPKWRYPYLEGPSTRPYTPTRSLLLQIHSHSNLANR